MFRLAALLAIAAPLAALADSYPYQESAGGLYDLAVTGDTAVITSQTDPIDAYTLTTDCAATHPALGTGTWDFGNGGWRIEIGGKTPAGFPRQEAPLDAPACAN